MKSLRFGFILALALSMASAQTLDIGNGMFFNKDGDLNVLVDASVAARSLDSPYVLFTVFMGMDANKHANINRKSVVLIYKGQEYFMPSLKEFREKYRNEPRDLRIFDRQGYDPFYMVGMNAYQYNHTFNFFPPRNSVGISTDSGSTSSTIALRTRVYFKNPGFAPGDRFIIRVKDKKNPKIVTDVVVELT